MENKNELIIQDNLDLQYEKFSHDEREKLYHMLRNSEITADVIRKLERLIYIKKPPTPEEFLDWRNGWITKASSEELFDWVKESFCEIINKSHEYNIVCFYGATRLGKSFLTRLLIYYTQIYINHLRHPQHFFGVSSDTNLAQYLICFNYNKTKQLLLEPIFKLIDKSERAIKVDRRAQVPQVQREKGIDYFVYSKASGTGEMTNAQNFQLQLGNASPLSLIGSDIIQTYVTEIAFFIESEGATEEEIFRLYSDSVDRIKATMGVNKPLAFTLLDSSANIADSKIESHILEVLSNQSDVWYKRMSRWDVKEYKQKLFPVWAETGKTFPVCTGNSTYPSRIIKSKKELEEIPKNLLIEVPIDSENEFRRNLLKSIKDIAGFPASSENKLIQEPSIIHDMFDENLPNVEGLITADSMNTPENLIWNQIYQMFFIKYNERNYIIKRAHLEPRYIHIDIAYSSKGDLTGIACVHKERMVSTEKDIYIVDFAFVVGAGKNEINLTAIEHFIWDLISKGLLPIKKVTADSFQNKTFEQNLKRGGVVAETLSVDRSIEPYIHFINLLFDRNIKSGKNIFLKNNLDSLIRTRLASGKEKIDHSIGETDNRYYGDWTDSRCGINAKDCSDAVAGALWACYNDNLLPTTKYEEENKKLFKSDEDKQFIEDKLFRILHKSI